MHRGCDVESLLRLSVLVDYPPDSHDSAWDTTESVSEAKLKYRYAELVSMADGTPRDSSCSQSNNDTLSAGYPPGPFARRFSRIRQRQGACARPSQKVNNGYIRVRSCQIHSRNAPKHHSLALIPSTPRAYPRSLDRSSILKHSHRKPHTLLPTLPHHSTARTPCTNHIRTRNLLHRRRRRRRVILPRARQ